MKSKAPLSLMEQMVMILVFALAAALCLQAFVKSDQLSRRQEAQSRASTLCQSVAELIKSGDTIPQAMETAAGAAPGVHRPQVLDSRQDTLYYYVFLDDNWQPAQPGQKEAAYTLQVTPSQQPLSSAASDGVEKAEIRVLTKDGILFTIEAAWQTEVEP